MTIFSFSQFGIGAFFSCAVIFFCAVYIKKKKEYLFLGCFSLVQLVSFLVIQGVDLHSFFPQVIITQSIELPFLSYLSLLLLVFFFAHLFSLLQHSVGCFKVVKIVLVTLFFLLFIQLLLTINIISLVVNIMNILVLLLLVKVNIFLLQSRNRFCNLFTVITLSQNTIFLVSLYSLGWFELDDRLFALSSLLMIYSLHYLVIKMNFLNKKEQGLALIKAEESATENQLAYDDLLALQEENQEQLESRVQERTLELNIALQELEEVNQELKQKNTLDELTGLYNRRFYDQKLLAEFRRSRRNLTPLSLVVIDIDHFKNINDSYGHSIGDQCLILIGKLMKQVLRRSSDIGCRYGGEEFCFILPETDVIGAVALADELRLLVMNHFFEFDNNVIKLTVSCGVCTYQQQKNATPVNIFDGADKALYHAKENGRNQVQTKEILSTN